MFCTVSIFPPGMVLICLTGSAAEEALLPPEMEELPEEAAFEEVIILAGDTLEEVLPGFSAQAAKKRVSSRQQKNRSATRRVLRFFNLFFSVF